MIPRPRRRWSDAGRRAARHGRRHPPARSGGRLSRRPCPRQPAVHRAAGGAVRPQLHRHFLGLSRLLAAVRQELPGAVGEGFEIETEISVHALELRMPVGEIEHGLWRAAGRVGVQALDLSRRLADPEDDRHALPDRAAGAVLRLDRRLLLRRRAHPRGAAGADLSRHRAGAALPDRDPGHRHDDHRGALLLRRADPRHGHARPARNAAACLSRASRAGTLASQA